MVEAIGLASSNTPATLLLSVKSTQSKTDHANSSLNLDGYDPERKNAKLPQTIIDAMPPKDRKIQDVRARKVMLARVLFNDAPARLRALCAVKRDFSTGAT